MAGRSTAFWSTQILLPILGMPRLQGSVCSSMVHFTVLFTSIVTLGDEIITCLLEKDHAYLLQAIHLQDLQSKCHSTVTQTHSMCSIHLGHFMSLTLKGLEGKERQQKYPDVHAAVNNKFLILWSRSLLFAPSIVNSNQLTYELIS